MSARWAIVPIVGILCTGAALADPREEYAQRNAERLDGLFRMADANGDGVVTRAEATGVIELQARFNEIDAGRDGSITREELQRFVDATFR
ncbi:MAG: hypothetical protein BroJett026_25620 [Betaproteobacteria bacterium]|nr:MAG: hypothetical protein BroJett026_25620 [Betaproteobacteria bacterium]